MKLYRVDGGWSLQVIEQLKSVAEELDWVVDDGALVG
jgi:hypothetical protein